MNLHITIIMFPLNLSCQFIRKSSSLSYPKLRYAKSCKQKFLNYVHKKIGTSSFLIRKFASTNTRLNIKWNKLSLTAELKNRFHRPDGQHCHGIIVHANHTDFHLQHSNWNILTSHTCSVLNKILRNHQENEMQICNLNILSTKNFQRHFG